MTTDTPDIVERTPLRVARNIASSSGALTIVDANDEVVILKAGWDADLLQSIVDACNNYDRLRAAVGELTTCLKEAQSAVNAAYQQVHAEWQMHDRTEERYARIVDNWRDKARKLIEQYGERDNG